MAAYWLLSTGYQEEASYSVPTACSILYNRPEHGFSVTREPGRQPPNCLGTRREDVVGKDEKRAKGLNSNMLTATQMCQVERWRRMAAISIPSVISRFGLIRNSLDIKIPR